MTHRQLKTGYFALAAMNTVATSYYFSYLFFFFRDHFGFGNRGNLGGVGAGRVSFTFSPPGSAGNSRPATGARVEFENRFRVAVRRDGGAALAGRVELTGQLILVVAYNVVLLLTWPALEALVSEGETQAGVQEMVGIYNCTWASSAAVAYFAGGRLYDALGDRRGVLAAGGNFLRPVSVAALAGKTATCSAAAPPEPRRKNITRRKAPRWPAGQPAGVSENGLAGQSVRLHRHQHPHCRHAGRRAKTCAVAHARRACFVRSGVWRVWPRSRCCGNGAAGITVSAGC